MAKLPPKNQQLHQLIDTFVHEIKTPLTTIGLFAEMTTNPSSSQKIISNANRVTDITNQLRDIFKIINGNYDFNLKKIPLTQLHPAYLDSLNPDSRPKLISATAPSCQINLNQSLYNSILSHIIDRIIYYLPEIDMIYINFALYGSWLIINISTANSLHIGPLKSNRLSLPNPNTTIYLLRYLISSLGGKYNFVKSKSMVNFSFSLPVV
jgi:signal transduction histidine kinase